MHIQIAGEVFRRNGAPYVSDPLKRLLPSLGLWEEYGFVQASLSPLARDALKVRVCMYGRMGVWALRTPKSRGSAGVGMGRWWKPTLSR